jgi:NAD(P)-dependent dehydrogenase (short-subunit alcohol dehydrogenase family)
MATFVTTWMNDYAARLFTENASKNSIDKDEYPQTAEIEGRATTPVEELLDLSFLLPDRVTDSLHAYQLAKRGNSLRVMAEAVRWGNRGARINTISPGIIITPLARDELTGPRGAGYRRMIEVSAAGRPGTPDEVGNVAALLMGPDGGFITGSDILMDGGVTAAFWFGELAHG